MRAAASVTEDSIDAESTYTNGTTMYGAYAALGRIARQTGAGAVIEGAWGYGSGFVQGYMETGTLNGALDAAWGAAKTGMVFGGLRGAVSGFLNPFVCFTAGTQVITDVEIEDESGSVQVLSAEALSGQSLLATLPRIVGYRTCAIESLAPGQWIVSRDEDAPDGPLVRRQVEERFERTAYQLTILTLRDSAGREQTIQTTAEHPAYVLGQGWVAAGKLKAGDTLAEPGIGVSEIVRVRHERHPEGIAVYNLRVSETHTYFVREDGSTAEPVWVHNTCDYTPELARTKGSARDVLNKNLGSIVGDGLAAHHTVPLDLITDPRTQGILARAARGGFNINALGVLLDSTVHVGGHPAYIEYIARKLSGLSGSLSDRDLAASINGMGDVMNSALRRLTRQLP